MLITMAIVFPAHAGMSPYIAMQRAKEIGFPRSRGDEPMWIATRSKTDRFSPLTRG